MSTPVLGVAVLTFCAWCVYLGGLASIQDRCTDQSDFLELVGGGMFNCMTVFRYWWFIMVFQIVLVIGALCVAAAGMVKTAGNSILGLAAVAAILYIQASDYFLRILTSVDAFKDGGANYPPHRLRTTVAGAIMTATFNCILVIVLGVEM